MDNLVDYQWPTPVLANLRAFDERQPLKTELIDKYNVLEAFFAQQFGRTALLFASARAAIGAILEYEKVGRGDTVFVPHYSPHCMWDIVGRYTSPTVHTANVKVALAVHKYGYVHQYYDQTPIIIEDSVDSLIIDPTAAMPLLGKYEIFSLPKILGTWCGGVVTTSDSDFIDWVKKSRQYNNPLTYHQSKLKYLSCLGKLDKFSHQNFLEPTNRELDLNGLINISDQINYINEAAEIIQQRLGRFFEKFSSQYIETGGRLPCVFPCNQQYFTVKKPSKWMVRHFNFKDFAYKGYQPCWILPLHFGVNDNWFNSLFEDLQEI